MQKIIPISFFIVSIILISIFDNYFPILRFFNNSLSNIIGIIIIIIGIIILYICFSTFVKNKTTFIPSEKSNELLTKGIYQYSRNPMYLGFLIVTLGYWFCFASLAGLIILLAYFIAINIYIINKEEKYLKQQFNEEYLDYQKQVRRWL